MYKIVQLYEDSPANWLLVSMALFFKCRPVGGLYCWFDGLIGVNCPVLDPLIGVLIGVVGGSENSIVCLAKIAVKLAGCNVG